MSKKAIIIGAGPAGLTAAYELLSKTNIQPIVIERNTYVGGISRTVNYKGNKVDLGGHRFFSKYDVILQWWQQFLPIYTADKKEVDLTYHQQTTSVLPEHTTVDPEESFLVVPRKSHIYYQNQLFSYPLQLSVNTFKKLGFLQSIKIGLSILESRLTRIREPNNLEEFYIQRFGKVLYEMFFKDYTEKVWGTSCKSISAEWGKQRVKDLSFRKIIQHYIKYYLFRKIAPNSYDKEVVRSLAEYFLYPAQGPGQLWSKVMLSCENLGGEVHLAHSVIKVHAKGNSITAVDVLNHQTKEVQTIHCDYLFSSMPVKNLIASLNIEVPPNVLKLAQDLPYRAFVIVGILLDQPYLQNKKKEKIEDNWLYIQDRDVKVGRLQIFNNWSMYMVENPDCTWVGAEYFCDEGDDFWNLSDTSMQYLAIQELEKIGIISSDKVIDATVVREAKAYPVYTGSYQHFEKIKDYLSSFANLYPIGRNGMHKYNNQDHSMLTAIQAVQHVSNEMVTKEEIWNINTEQEYHETVTKGNS